MMALGAVFVVAFSLLYIAMNALYGHAHGMALFQGIVSGANASGQLREAVVYSVLIAFFSGLVALAIGKKCDTLVWKLAERFGRVSYSGYLWHFAIITALRSTMIAFGLNLDTSLRAVPAKLLLWVFSMILLYPISTFLYRIVEAPCNRLGQFIWKRMPVPIFSSRERALR